MHGKGPPVPFPPSKHIPFTNLAPRTPTEHYWAARALKAEALLSEREKHHQEVSRVREEEQTKRTHELKSLERWYKEKHKSLERLIIILISALLLLIALLIYLTTAHTRQSASLFNAAAATSSFFHTSLFRLSPRAKSKEALSWLNVNLHLPSHFTIPILSPWTSVIEHQTSTTTNTRNSSLFDYLAYALLFLAIIVIPLVIMSILVQKTEVNQTLDSQNGRPGAAILGRLVSVASLSTLPSWWTWICTWGWKMLDFLGLIPR